MNRRPRTLGRRCYTSGSQESPRALQPNLQCCSSPLPFVWFAVVLAALVLALLLGVLASLLALRDVGGGGL